MDHLRIFHERTGSTSSDIDRLSQLIIPCGFLVHRWVELEACSRFCRRSLDDQLTNGKTFQEFAIFVLWLSFAAFAIIISNWVVSIFILRSIVETSEETLVCVILESYLRARITVRLRHIGRRANHWLKHGVTVGSHRHVFASRSLVCGSSWALKDLFD